jgi:hypothetical protein
MAAALDAEMATSDTTTAVLTTIRLRAGIAYLLIGWF